MLYSRTSKAKELPDVLLSRSLSLNEKLFILYSISLAIAHCHKFGYYFSYLTPTTVLVSPLQPSLLLPFK